MNFHYTALGSDNQKFTGSLQAMSLESAREKLHKMDLSIIALKEEEVEGGKAVTPSATGSKPKITVSELQKKPKPTKTKQSITTFYFVAKNQQDKEVNGTIDSIDAYTAYKRLIGEYKFNVLDFYVHGEEVHPEKNMTGSFENWNQKLMGEGIDTSPEPLQQKGSLESGPGMASEVVEEIDYFIKSTKSIIEGHQTDYSKPFLVALEKKLGNLERIRTSNNLNHITKVCNDIYKLIAHPEHAEGKTDEEREAAYQQAIQDLSQSGFIQSRAESLGFGKKRDSGTGGVKKIFGKIEKKLSHPPIPKTTPVAKKTILDPKTFTGSISVGALFKAYFNYIKEGNPILKRARKQEFDRLYATRKAKQAKVKEDATRLKTKTKPKTLPKKTADFKKDYTDFFVELDSFIGWLLFFYITYFFLASFSLERNIGLSQDLVIRTLSSPLIVNIFIFLLLAHLTLKLKLRLFHQNATGSGMLFFLSAVLYVVLLANF